MLFVSMLVAFSGGLVLSKCALLCQEDDRPGGAARHGYLPHPFRTTRSGEVSFAAALFLECRAGVAVNKLLLGFGSRGLGGGRGGGGGGGRRGGGTERKKGGVQPCLIFLRAFSCVGVVVRVESRTKT